MEFARRRADGPVCADRRPAGAHPAALPRHGRVHHAGGVEALRPRVQQITDELLDEMLPKGRADLVDSFAYPLPITVICELLGVPDIDRVAFRAMSNEIVTPTDGDSELAAVRQLAAIHELIEDKRCTAPGDDLLSDLIRTRAEDGDRLSRAELRGMAFILLVAGHETTVNLITNGVHALLTHPDQLAALRADMTLLDGAVEEVLRFEGPVETATYRYAAEPLEIGGRAIAAGYLVMIGPTPRTVTLRAARIRTASHPPRPAGPSLLRARHPRPPGVRCWPVSKPGSRCAPCWRDARISRWTGPLVTGSRAC